LQLVSHFGLNMQQSREQMQKYREYSSGQSLEIHKY
jgi:hypothetical protein